MNRKYSLDDLDAMRIALNIKYQVYAMRYYITTERADREISLGQQRVEEELRTLMMNGTEPEELLSRIKPCPDCIPVVVRLTGSRTTMTVCGRCMNIGRIYREDTP